jgi:hypothetical protein
MDEQRDDEHLLSSEEPKAPQVLPSLPTSLSSHCWQISEAPPKARTQRHS